MGYTHYIYETEKPEKIPAKAVAKLKELLNEGYEADVLRAGYGSDDPPIVTSNLIRFSGVGEETCEDFVYSTEPDDYQSSDGRYFNFCKTRQYPYDEYVMKAYLILAYYIPDIDISSDGEFDDDWDKAIDWANKNGISVSIEEKLRFDRI